MNKILSRGSLLKSDGRTLCEVGYGDKLIKSYLLKDIKGKGIDKFRENFEIIYYESGLCFIANAIRRRFFGEAKVLIFDFVNRTFKEKRVVEFLACKKYSLSKTRELHIKNREISLDFVDGKKKIIKVKTPEEKPIKIDSEISNRLPLNIVTANQFEDGFDYARNSLGYNLKGYIKYDGRKINLYENSNAIIAYNGRISTTKKIKNDFQVYAEGKINCKPFLLILDTLSDGSGVNSSMICYDGYTYKLCATSAVIKSDDGLRFLGQNDSFSIVFEPHILHLGRDADKKGIKFGKLKGEITLKNREKVNFENIGAFIAYNSRMM